MQCLPNPGALLVDGFTVIVSISLRSILGRKAKPPYFSPVLGPRLFDYYFVRAVLLLVAFL